MSSEVELGLIQQQTGICFVVHVHVNTWSTTCVMYCSDEVDQTNVDVICTSIGRAMGHVR